LNKQAGSVSKRLKQILLTSLHTIKFRQINEHNILGRLDVTPNDSRLFVIGNIKRNTLLVFAESGS